MRYLLIGRGRMGQCFREAAAARGGEIEAMLGRSDVETLGRMGRAADILVDFSRPEALPELCSYARRTATPVLSGTTGCTGRDLAQLRALGAHVPVLWSANYSLGIAVLRRAAAMAAAALGPDYDVEITERHHRRKADAPSGTALLLLQSVDPSGHLRPVYGRHGADPRQEGEVGLHALRGGTAAGCHSVYFLGSGEELTFTHRADSREIFAQGALRCAAALVGKPPGFYTLEDILFGA